MRVLQLRKMDNQTHAVQQRSDLVCIGLMLFMVVTVGSSRIPHILFHRIINDPLNEDQLICVLELPATWKAFDTVFMFIHHIVPLTLNGYATGFVIWISAR
ncbi:unnamed protein product, partial [Rotaria sp. Silwood2]